MTRRNKQSLTALLSKGEAEGRKERAWQKKKLFAVD
jgi:hypothetical protein